MTQTYVRDILRVGNDMNEVAEDTLAYVICNRCNVKDIDDISENIIKEYAKLTYDQRIEFLKNGSLSLLHRQKNSLVISQNC